MTLETGMMLTVGASLGREGQRKARQGRAGAGQGWPNLGRAGQGKAGQGKARRWWGGQRLGWTGLRMADRYCYYCESGQYYEHVYSS